jgi:hypothetical protein
MPDDRTFVERNRAATARIATLTTTLSEEELQSPVGAHWTVAIALAHLAFWDRRVSAVLDDTEHAGQLSFPQIDFSVNDLALPFMAALPPRYAARLAVESAETLDRRLEAFPAHLLDQLNAHNARWVDRSLHRNEHLDEIEAALNAL